MNFDLRSKGFLFTISIIMFASTLIFFAQNYSSINASNEFAIISSAKPVGVVLLTDDIAFGLSRIFDTVFDVNAGSEISVLVSGSVVSEPNISVALGTYLSALSQNLFPLLFGTKSLIMSGLADGVAEVFFGDAFEFDYDYSSGAVVLFSKSDSQLLGVDLNIQTHNDVNSVVWTNGPVLGSASFNLNYYDDSNYFSISQSFDVNSVSTVVIYYADGNVTIDLGEGALDYNSSIKISNFSGKKINYVLKSDYSPSFNPFPVGYNAFLNYSSDGFDTNSRILVRK